MIARGIKIAVSAVGAMITVALILILTVGTSVTMDAIVKSCRYLEISIEKNV